MTYTGPFPLPLSENIEANLKTPKLSETEFKNLLIEKLNADNIIEEYMEEYEDNNFDITNDEKFCDNITRIMDYILCETVGTDNFLFFNDIKNTLEVDFENIEVSDICSTDNGISCLSIIIGGDWEHPVRTILYYDGSKFRGYVPTGGNVFDPKTMSALGNSDDEDQWNGDIDYDFDDDLIAQDIKQRFIIG